MRGSSLRLNGRTTCTKKEEGEVEEEEKRKMTCRERGKAAEKLFAAIAQKRCYTTWATTRQDRREHKDVLISKGQLCLWVDVKARKRINRTDPTAQDAWILLELHGAGEHNRGWLYDSQADLIARRNEEVADGL
eukprot:m.431 g.431  ORF g.431 m.431 type:complete len:134 (+) comp206_c1_seq1:1185-1586(+)